MTEQEIKEQTLKDAQRLQFIALMGMNRAQRRRAKKDVHVKISGSTTPYVKPTTENT